jgi:nickel-dependent lactate racemase
VHLTTAGITSALAGTATTKQPRGLLSTNIFNKDRKMDNTVIGLGTPQEYLSEEQVRKILTDALEHWDLSGKRVLVVIPDSTRTAPIPMMFRLLFELLHDQVQALDYIVALGTHPVMSEEAINKLIGVSAAERAGKYAQVKVFNHRWEDPETFATIGTITTQDTEALSNGLLSLEVPVRVNKLVFDYDQIVICGPVFPHEVVGFSGGNKYFFPGISGPAVINFTHWLGALNTSYNTIGVKETAIRKAINKAAAFIDRSKLAMCMVVKEAGMNGLFVGEPQAAWEKAVGLSAQVHVQYVDKPYKQVLSVIPHMYDDLWTGAKGMYKLEPVIADGGEVILYAPHISEFSYTHGPVIEEIGFHVRDYFAKQWEQFKEYPWGVIAHSTHLRGLGSYADGIEKPRITVTLASSISRERVERVGLNYRDPATIDPQDWANRADEGILLVPHAGEILYRLKDA